MKGTAPSRSCVNAVDIFGLAMSRAGKNPACECKKKGGEYKPRWQAMEYDSAPDYADKMAKSTRIPPAISGGSSIAGLVAKIAGGSTPLGIGLSIPGLWNAGNWFSALADCSSYICVGGSDSEL